MWIHTALTDVTSQKLLFENVTNEFIINLETKFKFSK